MSGRFQRIRAIARKEMIHLLRDPRTLVIAFIQPVFLLLLYGNTIVWDLRRLPFAVWDQDHSEPARQLVRRLDTGGSEPTFTLVGFVRRPAEVEPLLATEQVRFVLVIPRGYGAAVDAGRAAPLQALFDGSDSNTAGVTAGYLAGALRLEGQRLALQAIDRSGGAHPIQTRAGPELAEAVPDIVPINVSWRVFYNPDLASKRFIVPGLIAILLTFLAATLTATTITRERELGSLEALLTSPVRPVDLILGKLSPYVLIAAGNIALVLLVGGAAFGVWPRGDLLTLLSFSFLFLVEMLALGMLISAAAPTQQIAAMFATLSTMLPNIFLTGFNFPRSNMPPVLQVLTWPLPATQYLIALRGVFLKGTGWSLLWPQGLWMAGSAVVLVALTVWIVDARMRRGLE